ncbi:gliding motility-associated C-terminal domain-containing protein [Arcticibacter tournemirensis]|uniref:Gliding motility-associated C-terminal domain-containing protein n=1 Tax=Arcticibacter tournemirensis TaxID=699437 RepID=A0A4Q0MEB7_9SPHI|nr:gliding motility-associated C-terminal domain-containing protein [Arcticibacter tournemirensis]RXF71615.1 gliding motility-associated C-terminal domain-containing protein [Arcticibacter tournemirensis]
MIPFRVPGYCCWLISFWAFFSPLSAAAQLCTGSLGDPIVNIDFGRGSASRGAPLAAGITNYNYSGSNVEDGFYTIVNNTSGMNQNWFATYDHTPGDSDGYMMLVNASHDPGNFYKVSITGLCAGTKYEAAAWIMNLLTGYDGKKPDITFWVETPGGDLIGQPYTTGEIPQSSTPQWLQYGFFFTTPSNTSEVVLNIRNNGTGGLGNDLVLDDITFRPCGPNVLVSTSSGNTLTNFCEGDDVNLELVASVSGEFLNPLTQWQRYDGTAWRDVTGEVTDRLQVSFADAPPGNYLYRLSVGEPATFGSERCRINSNVFTIAVNPKPVPTVRNDGPVCYGDNLALAAQGGTLYKWTGPNGFVSSEQSPVIRNITAAAAGVYQVTVTSAAGCIQTDQTMVEVVSPPVANAGDDVTICIGGSTALHAKGGTSYKWVPSVGLSDANSPDPIATPLQTTAYTVSVSNGACSVSDEVLVTVLQPAIANAGSDKVIIEGDSVMLEGEVTGPAGLRYYWTPSDYLDDPASLRPKASPPSDMLYTLHAESNNQCTSTSEEVFVKVFKKLIIPNTFSPNGDGVNDVWNIEALAFYPQSDIKVYNRYGSLVFSETGYLKPWDGKLNGQDLPPGVYYYVISPKPRLKPEVYRGWVIIAK